MAVLHRVDATWRETPYLITEPQRCRGSEKSKRREFIAWFREEAEQARKNTLEWMEKGVALVLPPGFFAPGGKLFANVFPHVLWT